MCKQPAIARVRPAPAERRARRRPRRPRPPGEVEMTAPTPASEARRLVTELEAGEDGGAGRELTLRELEDRANLVGA